VLGLVQIYLKNGSRWGTRWIYDYNKRSLAEPQSINNPMKMADKYHGWFPFIPLVIMVALCTIPLKAETQETNVPHLITFPGGQLSANILWTEGDPEKRPDSAEILWTNGTSQVHTLSQDKETGKMEVSVPLDMPPGQARVSLRVNGKEIRTLTIDIWDQARYKKADATASALKVSRPLNLLWLGDSLSAQNAEENHIAKLLFWLSKYNPNKIHIQNFAVGGDSFRTIWRRIQHLENPEKYKAQFKQEAYTKLWEGDADIIFIFLGHNDTKVSSKSGYTETNTPWLQIESSAESLINFLKEKTGAEIILISPVSPVEEVCLQRAKSHIEEGRDHLLYGKPEVMERFNKMLLTLASAKNTSFWDFYTPTKNHPEKIILFRDHVHLSPEGQRFLSELHLQNFSQMPVFQSKNPNPR